MHNDPTHRNALSAESLYLLRLLADESGTERTVLDAAVTTLARQHLSEPIPTLLDNACLEVCLTQGYKALVSVEDYDRVMEAASWSSMCDGTHVYARGTLRETGQHTTMHRFIMAPPDDRVVDHINGNGLDNRRTNLRICSLAENLHNARAYKSKYKGVWHRKGYGIWYAVINRRRLGPFYCPEAAALAYNRAIGEVYGEYAWLNPMDECEQLCLPLLVD
jgi:hypothetical protein